MNDQQKRARLREILADPTGAAAHLSGNAIHKNFCLPDRNLLTVTQIAQRVGQISEATDIPLIVDCGTICIEPVALTRAVKLYERAGAADVG